MSSVGPANHLHWSPRIIIPDAFLDSKKVWVESALERNHQFDPLLPCVLDGLDGLFEVGGDGLLAEDVLAEGCRVPDLLRVELRRRTDPHRLYIRVVYHLLGVAGIVVDIVLLGELLDGFRTRGAADRDDLGTFALLDRVHVHDTDTAAADDTNAKRRRLLGFDPDEESVDNGGGMR